MVRPLANGDPAQAVLSVVDGRVNGSLGTDQAFYLIRHVEEDLHLIQEVLIDLPAADDAIVPTPPAGGNAATGPPPAQDKAGSPNLVEAAGPTTLDVLVLYTTATRQARGGSQSVQDRILLAVAEANAGFINSAIPIELNLAGMVEIPGDTGSGIAEQPTRSYIEDVTFNRTDIAGLRDYYGRIWFGLGECNHTPRVQRVMPFCA